MNTRGLAFDAVAIAVFALLARAAHKSEEMPFTFIGWLSTLWPFLLGVALAWVILAAAKKDGMRLSPGGVIAWLVTVVTGLVIWSIRNAAVPHWSFILVASVTSAILMLGWRLFTRKRGA